jgi:ribosomal protein L7/L12
VNKKAQITQLQKELEKFRKEFFRYQDLTSQLSESTHNMYILQCETNTALQDADVRSKAILKIIARVTAREVSTPYIVLILTELGTTVPEQLINAVNSVCKPLIEKAQVAEQVVSSEALRYLIESLDADTYLQVTTFLQTNQKIHAIKEFRNATKCSLFNAKNAVELIQRDTARA